MKIPIDACNSAVFELLISNLKSAFTVCPGYDQQEPTIAQLVGQRENSLFQVIPDDESHVIHHLLPPSVSNT